MNYPSGSQSEFTAVDFNPFADGELLLTAPATESQKEIWASVQMGSDANCAYNESQKLWLRGILNVAALRLALQELVLRHEALRTTFSPDGINLCIVASLNLEIPEIDLFGLDLQERETKLADLLKLAVETPFDLEHGPLIRVQLIKTQDQEHLLLLTAHHIICDGWSWAVLMTDLGKLYTALKNGETPDLEEPEHFSEYAIAQQEAKGDEEEIATEAYWLNQFFDSIPVLDFPTDRPRPSVRTFEAAREDWDLSPVLVSNLKQLGTKLGCSFTTTLLTSFEVFLHRLTGSNEIIVGTPAAGQAATGNYQLVSHCVNLLPLRSWVDGHQAFSDYLQLRRPIILDAYDHQLFTFGSLIEKLAIPRDTSRIPLVPITFNLDQGLDNDRLLFEDLKVEFSTNPRSYENFEMFINATELRGKVTLECQYNTNLFDAATIRLRLAEFETLLLGIVEAPDTAIDRLPLLPDIEQQLLTKWNQTQIDYPSNSSIQEVFEAQVVATPDAIALIFENEQISFQELNCRANQLAHYLRGLGIGADSLVGIYIERSLETVIGILGILKAGGAYVPLDPSYPPERLEFMVTDTQVSVLLTQQRLVEQLLPSNARIVCLDTDWEAIALESQANPVCNVTPDNLAYVIYTSGSTGIPKGVSVVHRGVVRLVKNSNYADFSASQVFLQLAPLAFDASTFEVWGALLNGARLVLFPSDKPSLDELGQIIDRYNVTIIWLTAGLFHLMVDEQLESLRPLQQLLAGGDVLSVNHVQRFREALPNCRLINGYGPTESTTFTCCYTIEDAKNIGSSVPIGRPIANTQVYILNPQLQPMPIGAIGEIYIGGDGLASGYFNRPELTTERFVSNPFSSQSGAKLYKTGDLARYFPDGNIEFLGRIDNQVKIRGFRIELGEVEAVLSQYPTIQKSVVIVREDIPADKRIVAYFVPISGQEPTNTELRSFFKQKLPDYMIPNAFVSLESLPLSPNGKIARKELPAPDGTLSLQESYVPPRNQTEQQIADVWAQVLSLERVGIHDNFFELGGHSLLATQIIARLRKVFTVELTLRTFFEAPTIGDLGERIVTLNWAKQSAQAAQDNLSDLYEEGEL
ncbi:long-chain-fatty-acid--CoA ligase [Pseudanabaena sp. lw0831]|uniref:non-ribosomal peptide synthetase n=1 Tax=Pseudanabaena sp. lw0831 TaxID=1357935 RepID=UPI001914EF97|nr:non-ribosomal peptide synthetase [Pseudanabaena sp. lw0831]GBO51723.1 long-chain-fatty-acid--CoA ligase [Pseudanabaena sp. lw0831]